MIKEKYSIAYNKFITEYKKVHLNPWHNISEKELNEIYNNLIQTMDINDIYDFKYFMNYIIKRLSGLNDAHTKMDMVSPINMNFRIFNDTVIVNYPLDLKGYHLLSINDINIEQIIEEIDEIITYGTKGKRRIEIEKSLFNKCILFGLPSLKNSNELVFKLESQNKKEVTKTFSKNENNESFNYNEYLCGNITSYEIKDDILLYKLSSLQNEFKDKIFSTIEELNNIDLSKIKTIIIDIRSNTGGNSSLSIPTIEFLKKHKDKKLICLTDYRVFSAGRILLIDLKRLGALTIGEEISTPINSYGNSHWININNNYSFSISECYFNPIKNIGIHDKKNFTKQIEEDSNNLIFYKPDIQIEETLEDYLNNIDTILNRAIKETKQ